MSVTRRLFAATMTSSLFALSGCDVLFDVLDEVVIEEETPTKSKMQGV